MPKNHLSSPFEEDLRKERRRTRRRRGRKEKERKSGRRETHHPATFPIIVDRTKTSPFLRQRSRKYHSPDLLPSSSHSGYESAEFSDSQEFYLESMACLREAAACSTRSKLPIPKTIAELPQQKKRSRKKKEDHAHPLYPAYLERPPSRNGINFARDSPPKHRPHSSKEKPRDYARLQRQTGKEVHQKAETSSNIGQGKPVPHRRLQDAYSHCRISFWKAVLNDKKLEIEK